MSRMFARQPIPGMMPTIAITVFVLSAIVLIPAAVLATRAATASSGVWLDTLTSPRSVHAIALSVGAAGAAAAVDLVLGTIIAWALTRRRFVGHTAMDALVDVPFALPTAVAGIALTAALGPDGWLGGPLASWGIKGAYSQFGIVAALAFVGLPFVVRAVQPVLASLERELEQASESLGARPAQTFWYIIVPHLRPALVTGFSMALARALGEYGSIVFISGNMPMKTEVAPLLIMARLEQFDVRGAAVLSVIMLSLSLLVLVGVNGFHVFGRQSRPKTSPGTSTRHTAASDGGER